MILFKLKSVYEVILQGKYIGKPVRIEVFQSSENPNIYRARTWVRNTYNVYPMSANTGSRGEDLHNMHSSDDFNQDISTLIAEDDSFFNGKYYDSETQIIKYTLIRLENFFGEKLEVEF